MAEKTILFVTAMPNPEEKPAMQEYLQKVVPILAAAGGSLLVRGMIQKTVSGEPDYKMAMVMEFNSIEAVSAVFESKEYQELIPIRDRGFIKMDISLAKAL